MDDEEDARKIAAVVFITPRGVLGQYFDPVGQDRTPQDVEQRAANVVLPENPKTRH